MVDDVTHRNNDALMWWDTHEVTRSCSSTDRSDFAFAWSTYTAIHGGPLPIAAYFDGWLTERVTP